MKIRVKICIPVEILRRTKSDQAIGVRKVGEDSNFVAVFELRNRQALDDFCSSNATQRAASLARLWVVKARCAWYLTAGCHTPIPMRNLVPGRIQVLQGLEAPFRLLLSLCREGNGLRLSTNPEY